MTKISGSAHSTPSGGVHNVGSASTEKPAGNASAFDQTLDKTRAEAPVRPSLQTGTAKPSGSGSGPGSAPPSPGVDLLRAENSSDKAKNWSRFETTPDGAGSIPYAATRKGPERALYASLGPTKHEGSEKSSYQAHVLANRHANATEAGGKPAGHDQTFFSGKVSSKIRTQVDSAAVDQKDARQQTQFGDKGYPSNTGTSTSVGFKGAELADLRNSGFKPGTFAETPVPANHGILSSGKVIPIGENIGTRPGRTQTTDDIPYSGGANGQEAGGNVAAPLRRNTL